MPEQTAGLVAELGRRGSTVAVAESLTGGLLAAAFVAVPGSSAVFRGGLVVYAADLKTKLAGVPEAVLAEHGPVSRAVAEALAAGVRDRCGADWGVATTGVAGPEPHGGAEVGTVWLAVAGPAGPVARQYRFTGDRAEVRGRSVAAAVALLGEGLRA